MSNNWFTLTLDTTPPQVEIIAPYYSILTSKLPVEVVANEELDHWQEVYLIDANGDRYDFTFQHRGNKFYGLVDLSSVTLGIATLYVRVRDVVHNVSDLNSATIDIKAGAKIYVFVDEKVLTVGVKETVREIVASEKARDGVAVLVASRKVEATTAVRKMDVEVM